MEEIINLNLSENEVRGLRDLLAECLQKMKQAHETMVQDKLEIEQLQSETRAILEREWKAA